MSDNEQTTVEMPPLSPPLMEFLEQMKADRKKLLKDKAFTDPAQLRGFIGQFLYPRLFEMFEMVAGAGQDTYGLAYSNMTQTRRLRAFVVEELQRLGSDVRADDVLPSIDTEALDQFQQGFYALGTLLMKKLPADREMETAWNTCVTLLDDLVDGLLDGGAYDGDDEEGEDDDKVDVEGDVEGDDGPEDIEEGVDDEVVPPAPLEEDPEAASESKADPVERPERGGDL